jgi:hypothetical protein
MVELVVRGWRGIGCCFGVVWESKSVEVEVEVEFVVRVVME